MTPATFQRIKDIFAGALELEGAARDRYIAASCGDPALRAEVDALLAAHARADAIFDQPAAAYLPGMARGAERWIGRRLGSYQIVALLGRGGMSEVYRARRVDAEYDKEVAIKLVPTGFQAEFVLQRLRAERQILANLEHPNIARLLDGGATEEGFPFLVMELVEGRPLDEFCARLPVEQKLDLFREVCAAVSFAHARLVVHRDLKPGNILVTREGQVKLLDFGIAKLLQPSPADRGTLPQATVFQSLTPGFASPEQVLGKPITTTSDVYSLGVVLYLLLTGRSPYRGQLESAEDARREVCESEPDRPSSVERPDSIGPPGSSERLSRDLDAMVLRALRKEPDKRYASVEQFSEDIRRFLAGQPVVARGDEFGYRAAKFARRHKLELIAASLVLATLIGATVVSLREARMAERQRQRAERHFASVRKLADTFMFEVHDKIRDLPGATEARGVLVRTTLQYLNTLSAEAGDDASLKRDLANAWLRVADIQGEPYASSGGDPRAALDSYRKSAQLFESAGALDAEARRAQARSYLEQSQILLLLGEGKKALPLSQQAIDLLESPGSDPDSAATRRQLADSLDYRAYQLHFNGEQQAGKEHAARAIAILEDLQRSAPEDLELTHTLAKAYSMAGSISQTRQRQPEGLVYPIAMYSKALALDQQLVAQTHGENTNYMRSLLADYISLAMYHNGDHDYAATAQSCAAAEVQITTLSRDAKNAQTDFDAAILRWKCARAESKLGHLAEARRICEVNLATLDRVIATGDNLQAQYTLAATESTLADLDLIEAAGAHTTRAQRIAQLQHARELYSRALPRFKRVTDVASLDYLDLMPIDEARSSLASTEAALVAAGVKL